MFSRRQRQLAINQYVDFAALPLELHDLFHKALDDFLLLSPRYGSEIIRHLAKVPEIDLIHMVDIRTLAKFIRRDPSLVSKTLAQFETAVNQSVVLPTGRPKYSS